MLRKTIRSVSGWTGVALTVVIRRRRGDGRVAKCEQAAGGRAGVTRTKTLAAVNYHGQAALSCMRRYWTGWFGGGSREGVTVCDLIRSFCSFSSLALQRPVHGASCNCTQPVCAGGGIRCPGHFV